MRINHPAYDELHLAVKTLATNPGSIHARLRTAEPHFGMVFERRMMTQAEEHLRLRIGAGLVEGGPEGNELCVADSITLLEEKRAVEIAGDMLRLYELIAGLQVEDGYGH